MSPHATTNTKNISSKCVNIPTNMAVPDDLELKWKAVLRRYDANNDGRLSRKELKEAFKNAGSRFPGWRAIRALCHADKNRDGFIEEAEFASIVKYASKKGYVL